MSKIAEVDIMLEDGTSIQTLVQFKKVKKLDSVINKMIADGFIRSCGVTFEPESVISVRASVGFVH